MKPTSHRHVPPKDTRYECVCATRTRAFCLARAGKIQLNPSQPKLSSSPDYALPSRIVKEQHSVQPSPLAPMARVESCCGAIDRCCESVLPWWLTLAADLGGRARLRTRRPPAHLPLTGHRPEPSTTALVGGAGRDRTDGLLLAKQALSQLSYGPDCSCYLTAGT